MNFREPIKTSYVHVTYTTVVINIKRVKVYGIPEYTTCEEDDRRATPQEIANSSLSGRN